jgi:precorrin-6B methylase 2
MNNTQISIDTVIEEAKRLRDELVLQANLGAADAGDELSKLNDKYELFIAKSKEIFAVTDDSADELKIAAELGINADNKEDVMTALQLGAEEIKESYKKIKNIV